MTTDWAPDACTLPAADRPLRQAEFDQLFATSLRAADRPAPTRLQLRLAGPGTLAETVRDLTARESACCSFFEFTITAEQPGVVGLTIAVPADRVDVLDALAARATAATATAAAQAP